MYARGMKPTLCVPAELNMDGVDTVDASQVILLQEHPIQLSHLVRYTVRCLRLNSRCAPL